MRKYKLIILEAIVAMILLCTSVYAAINVNLSFRVTNRELNPGEEFKVRLTLNQIELENNKGITDIEGYINYNDDVIEEITAESITKNADGKVVIGEQVLDFEDLTNIDPDKMSSNLEGVVVFNGKPASGNDSKVIIGLKEPITTATQVLEVTFKIKGTNESITFKYTAFKWGRPDITIPSQLERNVANAKIVSIIANKSYIFFI